MKKSILALSLLAATLSAQAISSPDHKESSGAATGEAVAAQPAPAPATSATVNVSGASTVAGAPLLLSLKGAKAIDPTFQQLFEASQEHKTWKVTHVKLQGAKARVFMASTTGKASLEMDVAGAMVTGLKLQKGSTIDVETQVSGGGALIKFTKDKTPLGFMVNKSTSVSASK